MDQSNTVIIVTLLLILMAMLYFMKTAEWIKDNKRIADAADYKVVEAKADTVAKVAEAKAEAKAEAEANAEAEVAEANAKVAKSDDEAAAKDAIIHTLKTELRRVDSLMTEEEIALAMTLMRRG